jgi:hypothetical protein
VVKAKALAAHISAILLNLLLFIETSLQSCFLICCEKAIQDWQRCQEKNGSAAILSYHIVYIGNFQYL